MNKQILDENFSANNDIKSIEDVKRALRQAGINSFFEHNNGSIVIEEGEAVKLEVYYSNNVVTIKQKFPQIGNSVQIIGSGIILAIFLFGYPLPFPFPWVVALIGGQIISYVFFKPKTIKLHERIEKYL